jgi:hypothetical protein
MKPLAISGSWIYFHITTTLALALALSWHCEQIINEGFPTVKFEGFSGKNKTY